MDSHIIPHFHFKEIKGAENRYFLLSTDPKEKEIRGQKGMTEPLLCAQCDNERLSKYESPVREVLFGHFPLTGKTVGRHLQFGGYDYKRLKNGLLSVLWRMSITKDPFFSDVSLGPRHDERLRCALLTDAEIDEDEFPVLLAVPTPNGQNLAQCLFRPDHVRHANNRAYRCVISGMIFTFVVGSAPLTAENRYLSLRRKSWMIMRPTVQEVPFLATAMAELGQANRIRKQNHPDWDLAES